MYYFLINTSICNVMIFTLATINHTMICLITIKAHVFITKFYVNLNFGNDVYIKKNEGKGRGGEDSIN